MPTLLSLFILVLGAELPRETHYPGAVDVFRCAFETSHDKDYDRWPDGWTRRHGAGFPRYVRILIADESPPSGGRCVRIDLDGGNAAAYSPIVPAGPLSAYVLEGAVRTAGLKHDRAYLSLTFLDKEKRRLQSFNSTSVVSTRGWQKVHLGPVMPDPEASSFVLGIHLETKGQAEDLTGSASFGDLWVGRVPRVTLAAKTATPGKQHLGGVNLFTDPRNIEITWSASGLDGRSAQIVFQLEDIKGQQLARKVQPLVIRSVAQDAGTRSDAEDESPGGSAAAATWKPPIPGLGFYRVAASLANPVTGRPTELTLAVIEPRRASMLSEYGWSLPRGNHPLAMAPLGELLCQAGIHWVKYPLWCGDRKGLPRLEPLVAFSDRLSAEGIALVGLLGSPPSNADRNDVPTTEDEAEPQAGPATSAAQMFTLDPKAWYPSLEAIQARLGTQLRWWQLGNDRDMGWIGYTDVAQKIAQVKAMLDRIGQDVHVGMSWTWQQPLPLVTDAPPSNPRRTNVPVVSAAYSARAASSNPATAKKSWDFLALSSEGPMADRELADRLAATRSKGIHCWVTIEPLAVDAHTPETRAGDLVRRMIAAKIQGAEGIFCPDPFDPQRGLVRADGSPSELFLPWRNTALLVGGAEYLGSLCLSGGSSCHVFNRQGELTMALWNDQGVEETFFLGEKVRQFDVWGESTPSKPLEGPSLSGSAAATTIPSTIRAGHLPTFLTGLSEPVVRWQLDCTFGQDRLPSIADQPHATSLRLKNRFSQAISGRVVLVAPANWRIEPRIVEFQLAPGKTLDRPLEITLPIDAATGRNSIRIDNEIQADRAYRFSAFRNIEIGMGDVFIETKTRLNQRGELEIEQTLVNQGKGPVSFRCSLLAPDRCRQAVQVLALPPGRDQKVYRLPRGVALLGKAIWLHAEEIDGPRVLNYPISAREGGDEGRGAKGEGRETGKGSPEERKTVGWKGSQY